MRAGTVDAFQGSESDIVLISIVRANRSGSTGFQNDERVNVAVTRAKRAMVIVGNWRTIRYDPRCSWAKYLNASYARNNSMYMQWSSVQQSLPDVVLAAAPLPRWTPDKPEPQLIEYTPEPQPIEMDVSAVLLSVKNVLDCSEVGRALKKMCDMPHRTNDDQVISIKQVSQEGGCLLGFCSVDARNIVMSLLFDFLHIAAAQLTKMTYTKTTIYTTAQHLMELIALHSSYDLASPNMENKADVIEALLGAFRGWYIKDLLRLQSPLDEMNSAADIIERAVASIYASHITYTSAASELKRVTEEYASLFQLHASLFQLHASLTWKQFTDPSNGRIWWFNEDAEDRWFYESSAASNNWTKYKSDYGHWYFNHATDEWFWTAIVGSAVGSAGTAR